MVAPLCPRARPPFVPDEVRTQSEEAWTVPSRPGDGARDGGEARICGLAPHEPARHFRRLGGGVRVSVSSSLTLLANQPRGFQSIISSARSISDRGTSIPKVFA